MEWQFEAIHTVAAASAHPDLAILWMQQIHVAQSWQQLEDPPAFVSLGLKLAKAAMLVCPIDLKREIQVLRQAHLLQKKKILNGRQVLWLLYNHLRLSDADNLYELSDLKNLQIQGDNLEK